MYKMRVRTSLACAAFAVGCLSPAPRADAHPISMTSGQAVVHTNAVVVTIEAMAEDFMLFHELQPNNDNRLDRKALETGMEKHKDFLLGDFIIRDERGDRLTGEVVRVEHEEIPAEGWETGSLMEHTVTYHLSYPLAHPPSVLTFQQTFGSRTIPLPAVMELEVRQANLSLGDIVSLSNDGTPQTFDFDWSASERSGETPDQAWRRRRDAREAERMGITSYDAVYGFVYINNHEVRIELLIPLATLETWVEVPRAKSDFLEVGEQVAAQETLAPFFLGKNKVIVDGINVQPTLQRLDFYGVRFKDFAMRPEPERLSMATARVGAILSYSTKGPPAQVDITWEYFNAAVYSARTVLYAYQDTKVQAFTAYKPTLVWQSTEQRDLPLISALDANVTRAPSDEDATQLAGTLLRNIYRAFDYEAESDVYDALARSVDGDLLADLYLKIHQSLAMQEQGGAVARVKEVTVSDTTVTGRTGDGFNVHIAWTVEGTVEHWGHIHTRVNQYAADFTVRPIAQAWKITAMKVTDQQRLRYQVSVRRF